MTQTVPYTHNFVLMILMSESVESSRVGRFLNSGLSDQAAQKKWTSLFENSAIKRDQVASNNSDGAAIGKVWRLWIPVQEEDNTKVYQEPWGLLNVKFGF